MARHVLLRLFGRRKRPLTWLWAGQAGGTTPIGKVRMGEVIIGRTYLVTFDDIAFDTALIGP